jgi:asparagine synthase (glutamine-hydrolysing)
MQYSIENRSPYLDRRLFEFAYTIPTEYLVQAGYGKHILREAVKGMLNDRVRLDRHKKGFNASIQSLVNFGDTETRARILDDSPVYELVDRDKMESMMKKAALPNSMSKFLFSFLSAKTFLEVA